MSNNSDQNVNVDKTMFVNLVTMLATSAVQQMGNPEGKEGQEANLQSAQMIIDMLDMVERKTKNNLDKDEERILHDTLSSLKLAFVNASKQSPKPAQEPQAAKQEKPAGEQPPETRKQPAVEPEKEAESASTESGKPEGKQEDHEKKYHKSYG